MIKDSIDKMLQEVIVDHVPDITDSTGSSPMMEQCRGSCSDDDEGSSQESSSLSGSFASDGDDDDDLPEAQRQEPKKLDIAKREDAAVFRFKLLILGILAMCAIGISVLVYLYLNGAEKEDFETVYESYAFQMFGSVGTQLEQNLATMDSFTLGLLVYASSSNSSWPFVTFPESAMQLSKVRSQTKSSVVQLQNLIADEHREEYENYTLENLEWVNDTLGVQAEDGSLVALGMNLSTVYEDSSTISYSGQAVPTGSGPYAVTWQGYPLVDSTPSFNVDVLRQPVVGPAVETSVLNQTVVLSEAAAAAATSNSPAEPMTALCFPVLNDDGESVAVMSIAFQWKSFFEDILRDGERGLLVVVTNTLSQAFSYQIDGPKATFLGFKDMHDKAYNDFAIALDVADLKGSGYTGAPLDTEFCAYTITAYPTEEMEDDNSSIVPLLFTLATICIFALTAVIFLVYDMLVSYRQQKVMKAGMYIRAQTMISMRSSGLCPNPHFINHSPRKQCYCVPTVS